MSYAPDQLQEFSSAQTATLLRSNNIADGTLNFRDVQFVPISNVDDKQILKEGDVAVCMSNGSKALVGKAGRFSARSGKFTVGAFCSIFRPDSDANDRFVSYVFQSRGYRKHLDVTLAGSAINNLRNHDLELYRLKIPPAQEQAKIAQILDILDTQIRQTEALIAKLEHIKQGLLTDLLTRGIDENGQLRPPPEEAPNLYKDSPLGWIPREWDVQLLDQVAKRGSGHTPSKSVPAYWNGGVKWVSLADSPRLDQVYIESSDKEISDLGIANSSATKHAAGTVILSRDAGIGKSAILASEMAVSQHFMAWRCGSNLYNLFLYYWLQWMKPRFEAIALGSTIQTIGLGYFRNLRIWVPPRNEQDLIGDRLFEIERQIHRNKQLLVKMTEQKTGLMDDLLTGHVRVTPLLETAKQAYG
ncbi:MAG: restriction endonuclease subunit S [Pseudomonadota bacterium]|nr:restriction endonuclease subunit S [Pseudomonadota bacterium]